MTKNCKKCGGVMGYYTMTATSPRIYDCFKCRRPPSICHSLTWLDFTTRDNNEDDEPKDEKKEQKSTKNKENHVTDPHQK